MRRLLPAICLASSLACGSSPTGSNQTVFQLSEGAYRLQFGGASCLILSTGGSSGVGTSFEAPITVSGAGQNWVIASAGGTLQGTMTSDGRTMTAQVGGYFDFAGTRFLPGPNATDILSLSGYAAAADRFEGSTLSGRPTFMAANENGGTFATCQSGNFILRRAP